MSIHGPKAEPLLFLSYAKEDASAARRLCTDLRARDRRVWFAEDSIRGGERWRIAIEHAIPKADFFIALLSDVSVSKRGVVQSEIKRALDVLDELPEDRTYLIPTRLTPCKPSYARIRELQWIDMFPVWEDGLAKVVLATEPEPGGTDDAGPEPIFTKAEDAAQFTDVPRLPDSARLSDVVRQSVQKLAPYATSRGIVVRIRDEAPTSRVTLSASIVSLALTNVLQNALKYSFTSKESKTQVDVTAYLRGDHAVVEVQNIGPGIAADEVERIFQLGYRGRAARERQPLGAGLGLFVATQAIQDAKGQLDFESRPLRSGTSATTPFLTTVRLRLPRARSPEGATG